MSSYYMTLKVRLVIVVIALIAFLAFFWINQKYDKIGYGEVVELYDGINFSVVQNRVTKELLPTNYMSRYSYYSLFNTEESILYVKAKLKNTSNKAVKMDKIFKKAEIQIDNKNYIVTVAFEEENGKNFFENRERKINPNQEIFCYFGLAIGKDKLSNDKDAMLKVKAKSGKYEYKMQIKSVDASIKDEKSIININYKGQNIQKDETVNIPNVCAFKILGANFKDIVEPRNKAGTYIYYTASQGKKIFDLTILAKNSSNTEKLLEDMLGYVTLVNRKNNDTYELVKIVEENNGENFNNQANVYKISPNQERIYHLIVEVTQDIVNDLGELYINLFINGENYIYQII